ncbi:MAG: hypothetical protein ACI4U1_07365, partial [Anaerovoracaceae bacterium]
PRHRQWKQGLLCPKAAISGADGRMAKPRFRRAKNAVCSDHLFLEKDIRKKPAIGLITGFSVAESVGFEPTVP